MPAANWRGLLAAVLVCAGLASAAAAQPSPPPADHIAPALRQIVTGPERYAVEAIGLTATGRRIAALEPAVPPVATQRRVVLVAGLDGTPDSTRAVLDVLTWGFASGTPSSNRRRWQVAAVPCVLPDQCDPGDAASATAAPAIAFPPDKGYYDAPEFREARYLWRWVSMLGPDLVIEVRRGDTLEWRANALGNGRVAKSEPAAADSLAGALGTGRPSGLAPVAALAVSGPPAEVAAALRTLLQGLPAGEPSPMRRALTDRQSRTPLDLARMLAAKYPANPIMSYIPALSWSGALRVSALTGDPQYADRARAQMAPFVSGTRPAIAEPYQLTSLAGHQAFSDLGDVTALALAGKAADFMLASEPGQVVKFATGWTDDMFMATSVLARAAARTGDPKYADAVARLLLDAITRLQREDRLFIHAESGPHAWGRGNGFAAFGLMESLTHLPGSWPAGFRVAQAFERLMSGMRRYQAPDGAWHQVVDEPGTYREFTVTAMIVAAMARGLRLGWLDGSYREVVERGWRAVQARVSETGDLVDVCTGTGAGANATREYYLNRSAIFGPDDRGGAMALTAALEMHALAAAK
jgi:rhamnogalacturonyl hydrolase YesR